MVENKSIGRLAASIFTTQQTNQTRFFGTPPHPFGCLAACLRAELLRLCYDSAMSGIPGPGMCKCLQVIWGSRDDVCEGKPVRMSVEATHNRVCSGYSEGFPHADHQPFSRFTPSPCVRLFSNGRPHKAVGERHVWKQMRSK